MATIPIVEKLIALAERCEQATGPDRERDAQVRDALGLPAEKRMDGGYLLSDYFIPIEPKRYTMSLDEALTVAPPNQHWGQLLTVASNACTMCLSSLPADEAIEEHRRRLPAFVTAAALRARAAALNQGGKNGQ